MFRKCVEIRFARGRALISAFCNVSLSNGFLLRFVLHGKIYAIEYLAFEKIIKNHDLQKKRKSNVISSQPFTQAPLKDEAAKINVITFVQKYKYFATVTMKRICVIINMECCDMFFSFFTDL